MSHAPRCPGWRPQLRRALRFLRPHRRDVAAILGLTFAVAAASALEPLALKHVVDRLGDGGGWHPIATGVGALLLLGCVVEALGGVSNWMKWRLRLALQRELQDEVAAQLYRLPLAYHAAESVGGLMARLDRGINGFLGALAELAFHVLPAAAYLVLALCVMLRLDWRLSLVALAFTVAPALIGAWAATEQTRRERELVGRWSRIYSRFYETLTGIVTVKSFAREEDERLRFAGDVRAANETVIRGVAFDTRVGAAKNLAAIIARAAAVAMGGALVLHGEVTIGTLVAFLGYVGGIFGPVQGLTAVYETLRRGSVSLETILGVLDQPDAMADRPGAREPPRLRGEVRFEDVHFSYVRDRPVLRGLDLHVLPGEKVAIVGPSGAGKTTLMWLLLRFHDPTRGVVRVDGADVRALRQRALRRQMGVVLQETLLLRDSVRENIAYGRPGAARDEIEAAARAAGAHDFIVRLPDGYETCLGERGASLSAGERQRIAIARALLRDPAILILDEATSNLDPEAEAAVRQALAKLSRGRTTFVIAHRVSMARDADRILVLRHGHIAESGTHRDLAAAGGYYASMLGSHVAAAGIAPEQIAVAR